MTTGYLALTRDENENLLVYQRDATTAPTLEELQGFVGGWIVTAFTVESPFRPGYSITAYVNDEGLCIGLPIFIRVDYSAGYRAELAGNMIIMGLDDRDGESVVLTGDEIDWIRQQMHLGTVRRPDGTLKKDAAFILKL